MITDIESATFGSQNAYKYHINIVNYPLIGLKYVKINGINLFKKKDFARLLNKRDSEISKWLTGRHNFTTQTIARIETALGSKLISIAH